MKKVFPFVMLLALVSCSPTETSKPTSRSLPQDTPAPTSTLMATEPQARNTDSQFLTNCLANGNNGTNDDTLTGRLIIESENPHLVYLLDLGTKDQTAFDSRNLSNIQLSPDRNWIAYLSSETGSGDEELFVQSVDGTPTYRYPAQAKEWQNISHWLDNKRLVLWNHDTPLDSIVLFDPFTGIKDFMPNGYPDILPEDDDWDFYWPSITIFSPTLNELLYVAKAGNDFEPGYSKLVLWNNADQQAIAEVADFGYSIVYPLWLSTGEGALYVKSMTGYDPPVAHDEIYFIHRNGESKQLTHLTDYFAYARIFSYSLSSDEKFLAVALDASSSEMDEPKETLLILNVSTLGIEDLCISPAKFSTVIWSPDKYQLAISQVSETGKSRITIVDIVNKKYFESVEDFTPRGWLH